MASYSRKTVLAVTDLLANWSHSDLDRFLLEHGLEDAGLGGSSSRQGRANDIARYLIRNPNALREDGTNLTDAIVEEVVASAISACTGHGGFDYKELQQRRGTLVRSLERDGFTLEDSRLRRALPEYIDLPKTDDEVHALLHAYGFDVPQGHLDQAIDAHTRGDWAAANAQFRPFIESLFDEMARRLAGASGALPPAGQQRRQLLAGLRPPFFIGSLNEWTGDGKGFIEAFYRRLHPQGSHPGLSDEDDSTFRLHLVLVVARLLLRRLRQMRPP
jgi:hypothetical protein